MIASSYDNKISSFLVPQNLLDDRHEPLKLRPQKVISLAESTNVFAASPYFDVRYLNTDHLLVACRDHPIQLYSALPPAASLDEAEDDDHVPEPVGAGESNVPLASYRLISPATEAYIPVHSVVWPSPGIHFLVGGRDLIAQFDITRNGGGPSICIPTIPSRRHIRKGNGVGMRGTVSALCAQNTAESAYTGLVAAGTWTRSVGLYDFARGGECVSIWNVTEAASSAITTSPPHSSEVAAEHVSRGITRDRPKGIGGAGISQTIWSPCGRYLLINERQSTGMLIYDVRVTNKVLGFLAGRDALTHQRLDCDVFRGLESVGGFEAWAGTRDGTIKAWEGVGNIEGCQWPTWDFSAGDSGAGKQAAASPALGSVALHHSGSVVATCSGCWTIPEDDESDIETDSSLSASSQSDEDTDDDTADESSCTSGRTSILSGPLTSGRKFEESTIKLWKIGSATQVRELNFISRTEALGMEGPNAS